MFEPKWKAYEWADLTMQEQLHISSIVTTEYNRDCEIRGGTKCDAYTMWTILHMCKPVVEVKNINNELGSDFRFSKKSRQRMFNELRKGLPI